MSEDYVDTERSGTPTHGQDCTACRNGVHADCAGAGCGCFQRTCERAAAATLELTTKPQRLLAQWAAVPGDIAQGSHSYEGVLMETADLAHDRLQQVAAKEGKRLKRPVMCRVVVEAWTEDE